MLAEIESNFPGSRINKLNGKPIDPNIKVSDLVDDLEIIYEKSNSKEARDLRETKRKNTAYINAMSNQKHLKI